MSNIICSLYFVFQHSHRSFQFFFMSCNITYVCVWSKPIETSIVLQWFVNWVSWVWFHFCNIVVVILLNSSHFRLQNTWPISAKLDKTSLSVICCNKGLQPTSRGDACFSSSTSWLITTNLVVKHPYQKKLYSEKAISHSKRRPQNQETRIKWHENLILKNPWVNKPIKVL